MNGGLCTAFTTAANVGSSSDAPRRPVVVIVVAASASAAAPARRRLDRVVVERERPVDAAEQLVDDTLHLAVAQARVGALHQRWSS